MGTAVLLGLALLAFGGAGMKVRVRRTSWHTVQAQHRALATMGKLAAEHSKSERPNAETPGSKSAVRVVLGDGSSAGPSATPVLRSRPRRAPSAGATVADESEVADPPAQPPAPAVPKRSRQVLPGPSVKLVHDQFVEPLATHVPRSLPAVPRAVLPVIPAMRPLGSPTGVLRFDSLAEPDPRKTPASHVRVPKPPKYRLTGSQLKSAAGRVDAAATSTLLEGRRAFAAVGAWLAPLLRSLFAGGRSLVGNLSRRPRAATGAAAGLLVLVAIAGLGAIAGSSSSHQPVTAVKHSAVDQRPSPPPVVSNGSPQQTPHLPASLLEMTSSTSALYQVSGPISVVLDASGPCWVQARRSGPNGGLLFQGTLVPGQTWTVAGPTWLRLGNPTAVSLTINGEPVSPPASRGIPFDLQIG